MPPIKNTANDARSDAPDIGFRPEDRQRYDRLLSYLNVSKRIIARRFELGLSQEALGKAAGSKQSKISELELMKGNPRFDTLVKIARALGLVVDLVPAQSRFTSAPTVSNTATSVRTVEVSARLVAAGSGRGGYTFEDILPAPFTPTA